MAVQTKTKRTHISGFARRHLLYKSDSDAPRRPSNRWTRAGMSRRSFRRKKDIKSYRSESSGPCLQSETSQWGSPKEKGRQLSPVPFGRLNRFHNTCLEFRVRKPEKYSINPGRNRTLYPNYIGIQNRRKTLAAVKTKTQAEKIWLTSGIELLYSKKQSVYNGINMMIPTLSNNHTNSTLTSINNNITQQIRLTKRKNYLKLI